MNAPRVDTEYPFCTSVSVNEDTVFSFWVVELSSTSVPRPCVTRMPLLSQQGDGLADRGFADIELLAQFGFRWQKGAGRQGTVPNGLF